MTRRRTPPTARDPLRDAQLAAVARASLLLAVLAPALLLFATGSWTPVGALGAVGTASLAMAAWASFAPVMLQALALDGSPAAALPRERIIACRAIRRPEEPGRPGRARPRAPAAGLRPRPAR